MNRLLRRRRITIVALTLAAAAIVGYIAAVIGVEPVLTVLVVALVIAAGSPFYLFAGFDEREWSRPSLSLRRGTRREVTMLSWAISRDDGATSKRTSERLRGIAASRLSRIGVDLDDPNDAARAERALGPTAYRVITDPAPRGIGTLLDATNAIASIGDSDTPRPATRKYS